MKKEYVKPEVAIAAMEEAQMLCMSDPIFTSDNSKGSIGLSDELLDEELEGY